VFGASVLKDMLEKEELHIPFSTSQPALARLAFLPDLDRPYTSQLISHVTHPPSLPPSLPLFLYS
jgi:hypothetical protein